MSGPTRPAVPGNDVSPGGPIPEPGAHQVDRKDNSWIAWLVLAVIATALALWAAIYLGNGLHWLLWALAAILLVAGAVAAFRRGGRWLKRGLLIGSILFSVATLIVWAVTYYSSSNTAARSPSGQSATATAQAAPPRASGTAQASPSPAPTPAPAVAAYPDPNHREYDETPGTNDAVPAADYLFQQRTKAADLQLPPGDNDFRPAYAPSELSRLANWELDYVRQHPDNAKVTDLAHYLGMPGNPDGNAVADYMAANAELRAVGPEGLHVNNYTYDSSGKVAYSKDELLPPDTLVWFRKADNQPIVRWSCFNLVVLVR